MPLYKPDSSDSSKQSPNSNAKGFKQLAGYAIIPAPLSVNQPPSYVIINNTGSYAFTYRDYTGGRETPFTSSYMTGSVVNGTNTTIVAGGPGVNCKLDINPVGWVRADGATNGAAGDVTFVYKRIS